MANIYDMSDTWNALGTTFTAIKMNVTDTDSASGSLLMDLQVGGSSFFRVDKTGRVRVKTFASFSNLQNGGGVLFDTNVVMGSAGAGQWALGDSTGATRVFASLSTAGYFQVDAGQFIGFGAVAGQTYNAGDVRLYRDAANTLAQRNSTNAQTFNIYNTYTDASNYERGFMKWNSNVFEIGTDSSGTGTARVVRLKYGATTHLQIESGRTLFSATPAVGNGVQLVFSNGANFSRGLSFSSGGGLAITDGSTGGQHLEMREMTAPSAPSANGVYIYAEDNGSGKTRLMALFPTGAAQQIAIEP